MELSARLDALTADDLAAVVSRVLKDTSGWPLTWTVQAPGWVALSPSTRGVFRVIGTAWSALGGELPWAAVLKVVGAADYPGYREPHEGNYWRREPLVLASGLLDQRPAQLVPVGVLEITEVAPDEVWMWLQCLDRRDSKVAWGSADRTAAAEDLASFSAVWSTDPPSVNDYPWMARHWLRGWLDYARFFGAEYAADHEECWGHPMLAGVLPSPTRRRFVELMADAESLLGVLEALPVTLAHHDAQWRNLFVQPATGSSTGSRGPTVAVDWAFVGLAPVGADLGHMIGCDLEHWAVDPAEAHSYDESVTAAYLRGLAAYGWRGDERTVRFARAVSAALQILPTLAAQISWLSGEPGVLVVEEMRGWPEELAARQRIGVEAALAGWSTVFTYLLGLGDEARELADVLK